MHHRHPLGAPEVLTLIGTGIALVGFVLLQFSQRRFIVDRYRERGLDHLRYFQHPVFLAMSHPSWRTWSYSGHLALMMIAPLHRLRWNPFFSDVSSRDDVLRHFSLWEKISTAWVFYGGLAGFPVGMAVPGAL